MGEIRRTPYSQEFKFEVVKMYMEEGHKKRLV